MMSLGVEITSYLCSKRSKLSAHPSEEMCVIQFDDVRMFQRSHVFYLLLDTSFRPCMMYRSFRDILHSHLLPRERMNSHYMSVSLPPSNCEPDRAHS
jgi:hypothetical protein